MNIKISYQPVYLAPPFAYASVLDIELQGTNVKASLEIEYTGRDELSEKELKEHGFTSNDDYSWQGILHTNWEPDVAAFESFSFRNTPDEDIYLHVAIDGVDLGFPKDIQHANMLFQELVQAILESDQLESPLSMQLKLKSMDVELKWNFAEREFYIDNEMRKNWNTGREVLNKVYSIDFERVNALKKPKAPCFGTSTGEWFPIENNTHNQLLKILT
ncbi:hypothetical protein [Ekhidna sp.]|uniref:hypothetical protein n=1 Tax=Ekhidna sp. TaxID=2608089 RepID=UPI003CCBC403